MKKLLFLYKTPRWNTYKNWKRGKGPDTILYGANHLKKLGYKVDFYDFTFSKFNPARWIFYPIFLLIHKASGLGFKMDQALCLLPIVNSYDCIISTIDTAGLPFLWLKKLGLLKKPLIYLSIDFAFRIKSNNNWIFNWYKGLLKYADTIICYDEAEKKILKKFNKNVYFFNVGIDRHYFADSKFKPKQKNKEMIILAFGRDRDRDYQTFVSAVSELKVKGEIVCSKENVTDIKLPSNINVFFDLPYHLLKKKIYASDIIVIPVKNVKRPGGHLSMLDSMFSKRPVVISGNKWITSAYKFKNNEECLYFKPENVDDLKSKINLLIDNPSLSNKLTTNAFNKAKKYSTKNFALKLSDLIESLVN